MMTLGLYLAHKKTIRAGFVPYTMRKGVLYFLLARHRETGELGDLGGGVRQYEGALQAGLRELDEETHGLFNVDIVNANDLTSKIALIDKGNKMSVIFWPISPEWINSAPLEFQKRREQYLSSKSYRKQNDEISELVWLDELAFKLLIFGRQRAHDHPHTHNELWQKVKNFFQQCYNSETSDALKIIYSHTK
jgi:hypothetical protein